MKKILAILLACGMTLSFTGCFDNSAKKTEENLVSEMENLVDEVVENETEKAAEKIDGNDIEKATENTDENDTEKATENTDVNETDISNVENALEEYQESIDGKIEGFDDINKYIEAVVTSEEYTNMMSSLEGQGMKLELAAEENNLVYKYTYTVDVADDAAVLLNESLSANSSALATAADTIRIEAPCVEKVVYAYYAKDGKLITSVEF